MWKKCRLKKYTIYHNHTTHMTADTETVSVDSTLPLFSVRLLMTSSLLVQNSAVLRLAIFIGDAQC